MAVDSWMPHQFRNLSSRLVTQNGVILMGAAAVAVLLITQGRVSVLVVLYSINVFLTFTLSLAGLVKYWWIHRHEGGWVVRIALSLLGLLVCAGILVVTTVEKFAEGGWITLIITGLVIGVGYAIRRHYNMVADSIGAPRASMPPRPVTSKRSRSSCRAGRRRRSSSAATAAGWCTQRARCSGCGRASTGISSLSARSPSTCAATAEKRRSRSSRPTGCTTWSTTWTWRATPASPRSTT